jgi:ribonuclease R
VTSLKNDYYHFDPVSHALQGERTGTRYRLGDELRVKVMKVSLDDRKIDFDLVETAAPKKTKRCRCRIAVATCRLVVKQSNEWGIPFQQRDDCMNL